MLQLRGFASAPAKVCAFAERGACECSVGGREGATARSCLSLSQTALMLVLLQVKLLEFHPVQPWICYADTSDRVRVWDWTTQQVRGGTRENEREQVSAVGACRVC